MVINWWKYKYCAAAVVRKTRNVLITNELSELLIEKYVLRISKYLLGNRWIKAKDWNIVLCTYSIINVVDNGKFVELGKLSYKWL